MTRHTPVRTCVVCRQKFPQKELERFTYPAPGLFLPDAGSKKEGRGYYFCQSPVCQRKKPRFRPGRKVKNGAKKHNESQ